MENDGACFYCNLINMQSNILQKAIESLAAQNENGQFDQLIESLNVQFQETIGEEKRNEEAQKYGLTIEQYEAVIHAYEHDDNPLDCFFYIHPPICLYFPRFLFFHSLCICIL